MHKSVLYFCCEAVERTMLLVNYCKKVKNPALCAFKKVMKELQEHDAILPTVYSSSSSLSGAISTVKKAERIVFKVLHRKRKKRHWKGSRKNSNKET